ncbi:hypothetical protein [Anaeromassilibacillus sp. An200]|uniref:hypothetical protein n=1 Tax=Anaeromassilibacillus sp. An200 TaxID=1965587 RepID=UPI000B3968CF|nr:hypothetical protein [Anaeromassilibacillus sp. An200]OUP12359.1 hypothetical protein B5F35_09140 [Anaeromassilibacillus sp. An200]
MDWMSVTNLNAYVKGLKLKTTWDLKQEKGDVTAKGMTLEEWLESSKPKPLEREQTGQKRDEKLATIHAKLDVGGKLTPKERDYLKEKDPLAYQELVQEERAQKAYERALRRCKTKEEVKRMLTNSISRSMMVIGSIEHNPNISQQKKLEIAMREKRKVDSAAKATREFARRGELARLPEESEKTNARLEQERLLFQLEKPADPPPFPHSHTEEGEKNNASAEPQAFHGTPHVSAKNAYAFYSRESTVSDIPARPAWNKKA